MMSSTGSLRNIPKVDRVMEWMEVKQLLSVHARPEVLSAVRSVLDGARNAILGGTDPDHETAHDTIVRAVAVELHRICIPSLRPVINGTGVVIHTNLGRSPLADEAVLALQNVAHGYSNLEYRVEDGERGTRYSHVEGLICELTGAEAALVVNNNAAAVILALSSVAGGGEVIVSRGELVEIGGSFRIPDVMRQSGAKLVEVGTTNRTHSADYRSAITGQTACLLKVHTSNFAIVGFSAEVGVAELAAIGSEAGVPVMVDAGSGCLVDLSPWGISGEPVIRDYLQAGADVVTFSGDKLLGGPQAGIIAGRRNLVDPMKHHPLLRAFRIDKLTLVALEATLRLYRDQRKAISSIPTLRMLTMTADEIARRATRIIRTLRRQVPAGVRLVKIPGESSPGGGSFPLLKLPTTYISITAGSASPDALDAAMRGASVPVIGRINRDHYLLDVRTILDQDLESLAASLGEAAEQLMEVAA